MSSFDISYNYSFRCHIAELNQTSLDLKEKWIFFFQFEL